MTGKNFAMTEGKFVMTDRNFGYDMCSMKMGNKHSRRTINMVSTKNAGEATTRKKKIRNSFLIEGLVRYRMTALNIQGKKAKNQVNDSKGTKYV